MKRIILPIIITAIVLTSCNNTLDISNILSEGGDQYTFENTKWGYSEDRVELAELKDQNSKIYIRRNNLLVYHCKINDIPALRVYTFKDKKLRAAGYVTYQPIRGMQASKFTKLCIEKYGTPQVSGYSGMTWHLDNTVIYANAYTSYTEYTPSRNTLNTPGGVLSHLPLNLPNTDSGTIERWDGVWSYIDKKFYDELHEIDFPLDELSYYEKLLFGIVERSRFIQSQGIIFPQ